MESTSKTIIETIKTAQWITDKMNEVLKKYSISEQQFNVLRILRGAKDVPISVQDIGDRMITKNSNVTRLIDKLLERGLVKRKECRSNRRKMDILITPSGLELLSSLDPEVEALNNYFSQQLTTTEFKELFHLLTKIKS